MLNFTVRVNDTLNNFNQSEQLVNVADNDTPTLHNISFSAASITDGNKLNLTINVSDNTSNINTIRFNFTNPDNNNFSRVSPTHFELPSGKSLIFNYTFFSGGETSLVGTWNLTYVSATDQGGNIDEELPNITFTVNAAPTTTVTETITTEGGGGGGGGGGSIVTKIAALDIIVPPQIALDTKDAIIIPILLRNVGEVTL